MALLLALHCAGLMIGARRLANWGRNVDHTTVTSEWGLLTYPKGKRVEIRVFRKYGEATEFVVRHRIKNYSILPITRCKPIE